MRTLWRGHRWLTITLVGMIVLLGANLVGLAVDPRVITGSPAWLKPAKFSLSTALYAGTLAWVIGKISVWPRSVKAMGTTTAFMLLLEIVVINLQAWRGTTSHFNLSTKLDAALFGIMGIGIAVLWITSAGIAAALFRQKFSNQTFGWALRLGMLITVVGSGSGGLMIRQVPGQTTKTIGSHTVGAPDGGAAMPGTGWSTDHGDLRIAHFLGLHGIQAIPLLYWLMARRRKPQVASVGIAAGAYFFAFVLLEWQALRGQSLLEPDALTTSAWTGWLALVGGAMGAQAFLTRQRTDSANAIGTV